jgi:hypothetical protein
VLHGYADRGVLRNFEERNADECGWRTGFQWTLPYRVFFVADLERRRLTCRDLLPAVEARSQMRLAIDNFIGERHVAALPEHRRIDPRRATARSSLRAGRLSLSLEIMSAEDWAYATEKMVNLVHELLVFINLYWVDYAQNSLGTSQD